MKTEEDTFDALRRPHITEMKELVNVYRAGFGNSLKRKAYVESLGWGWLEYLIALKKWEGR